MSGLLVSRRGLVFSVGAKELQISYNQSLLFYDVISLTGNLNLPPSLTYLADTKGNAWYGSPFAEKKLADQLITNVFMNYKNLFAQGFKAGVGINNLFKSKFFDAQPHLQEVSFRPGPYPYPGQSRE